MCSEHIGRVVSVTRLGPLIPGRAWTAERIAPSCSARRARTLYRSSVAGAEIKLLTSLLDGIDRGGQALVLGGEPGIGKSRLLAEVVELARSRGMTVISATGVQSEAHLSFAGLHQLLRPVRTRAADLLPLQRGALARPSASRITWRPSTSALRWPRSTCSRR